MSDHGTKTALGVAHYFRQLNGRRPRVITELVTAPPRYDQEEIAALKWDGVSLALKLQAASPALYHMEVCKDPSGEAQRPRSGKLTSTKEPTP
jgi:hypothetical protein